MSIRSVLSDYIVGLQHVGHVVPDIDVALESFRHVYGLSDDAIRRIPEDPDDATEALFAFVSLAGSEFELIQPISDRFRRLLFDAPHGGAGINHVAWRVNNIGGCMEALRERGIGPGHVTPDGVLTYGDMKLVYLDPDACGGMYIELIEYAD